MAFSRNKKLPHGPELPSHPFWCTVRGCLLALLVLARREARYTAEEHYSGPPAVKHSSTTPHGRTPPPWGSAQGGSGQCGSREGAKCLGGTHEYSKGVNSIARFRISVLICHEARKVSDHDLALRLWIFVAILQCQRQ